MAIFLILESLLTLMGKTKNFIKMLNWLVFTLIIPFGYSYILLGELHRKLVTVLNWLIYTFKVIIKENLGILSPLIYPLIPSSSAPFEALCVLHKSCKLSTIVLPPLDQGVI